MSYVAIVPSRVPFCYATRKYFPEDGFLSVETLERKLSDWRDGSIQNIDIIGGEVSQLESEYLSQIIQTIRKFYKGEITIFTDLSNYPAAFDDPSLRISVFWNSHDHEKLTRIGMLPRDFELHVTDRCNPSDVAVSVSPFKNITSIQFPYDVDSSLFQIPVHKADRWRQVIYIMPSGLLSYGR